MKRELPVLFSPRRWPVKVRLAVVSATLTFVILLCFALVIGRLVENRLRNDFREELESTANQLAFTIQVDPITGGVGVDTADLETMSIASDATIGAGLGVRGQALLLPLLLGKGRILKQVPPSLSPRERTLSGR